jgi:hypothetical protein
MKIAIVTAGIGHWYPKGTDRLVESIHKFGGSLVFVWRDAWPAAAGDFVRECPYTIKPFAIADIADTPDIGIEILIWIDAGCYAIRSLETLIEHIAQHGYYFADNGFPVGQWCSDAALEPLKIEREQSFGIPELSSMVMGLDLRRKDCRSFVADFLALARDGKTFPGFHTNSTALLQAQQLGLAYRNVGFVSSDARVLGHRHDQTAASVLAWRRGWKGTPRPIFVDYWKQGQEPDERTCLLSRGM